jgi:hypothetical protein
LVDELYVMKKWFDRSWSPESVVTCAPVIAVPLEFEEETEAQSIPEPECLDI